MKVKFPINSVNVFCIFCSMYVFYSVYFVLYVFYAVHVFLSFWIGRKAELIMRLMQHASQSQHDTAQAAQQQWGAMLE